MQNAVKALKSSVQMTIIGHFFTLSTKNVLVDNDFRFFMQRVAIFMPIKAVFYYFSGKML